MSLSDVYTPVPQTGAVAAFAEQLHLSCPFNPLPLAGQGPDCALTAPAAPSKTAIERPTLRPKMHAYMIRSSFLVIKTHSRKLTRNRASVSVIVGSQSRNLLRFAVEPALHLAYFEDVPSGTMDINALVISGSDPGAVPGGSTKNPSFGDHGAETGSTNV